MAGIFISYRQSDSAGWANWLYGRLKAEFGELRVFRDVNTNEPGIDYVAAVDRSVAQCDALIVVIGPRWLAAGSRRGKRRLDDPRDLVRLEVEKALARDIRVIPVLIDDAPIPTEESLPDGLKPLARRSAVAISNENAETDIGPLIKSLRRVVSSVDIPVTNPLPLWTPARGLFLSMRLLIGVIEPMIALLAVMIPTEELYGSTRTPLFISICIVTGLLVPLATRLLTTAIYGRPARTLDIVVYWQGFVLSVGALLLPATAFDVGLSPTISLAGAAVLGFLLLRRRLATLSAGKAGARSTA